MARAGHAWRILLKARNLGWDPAAGKPGQGMTEATKSRGAKGGKPGRPLTAAALDNAALHYLGRFATSSANLRRILMRKVTRRAASPEDAAAGAQLVEELI